VSTVSVLELEKQILEMEQILVIFRTSTNSQVKPYLFKRKARKDTKVKDWIKDRVQPLVGDTEIEIIDGNYSKPCNQTDLESVRTSYVK
jgi:hypothetical protein